MKNPMETAQCLLNLKNKKQYDTKELEDKILKIEPLINGVHPDIRREYIREVSQAITA